MVFPKIIIVEGLDNTGKDTLIYNLKNYIENELHLNVSEFHCSVPPNNILDDSSKLLYQDNLFKNLVTISGFLSKKKNNVIIFNRSWYGEYVYGVLYRNANQLDVLKMIDDIEDFYLELFYGNRNLIAYVQLMSSDSNMISNNEDGKSISGGDIEKIEAEKKQFEDIFNYSLLKKHIVYVNKNTEFKSKNDILNEVLDFVCSYEDTGYKKSIN